MSYSYTANRLHFHFLRYLYGFFCKDAVQKSKYDAWIFNNIVSFDDTCGGLFAS